MDDSEKEKIYKDCERTPIKLFINSYGGSVYDGLALIDVIKNSRATLMFHDISTFAVDKTEGIKQELNEMLRLQQMV